MSALRQDPTSGRWAVVAPQRGGRPGARAAAAIASARPPAADADCPFCPGHEDRLPGIIAHTPSPEPPGWSVRVVPNKFPAVQPEPDAFAAPDLARPARDGFGAHEVIIESPRHDADLATMTDEEIVPVVSAYRNRSRALLAAPGVEAALVFRNHGPASGASLTHPHAQAIALGVVPPRLAALADWGAARFHATGACPTCAEIAAERTLGVRIVEETESFLALVPFAAELPSETWILPKGHQASFADLEDARVLELARLLRASLARIARVHGDPPYNFAIESAPRADAGAAYVHWRLRIAPLLAVHGGFELGADLAINPSCPEDDAARLREAT